MAKVLVVDDSGLSRRLIAGAVKQGGHEVLQAADGADGLKAFRAFEPDCVMSDLLMPVMGVMMQSAAMGALPTLRAAVDPESRGGEYYGPDGFLHRFLAMRGPGPHHVTFKVRDIRASLEEARACGYTPVGFDDRSPS